MFGGNYIEIKMELKEYKVNKDCIGCRACVELDVRNFSMNENNKAYVSKQPETIEEEKLCDDAVELCPVFAIEVVEVQEKVNNEEEAKVQIKNEDILVVTESDNVKRTLDRLPELKQFLINISPKFKKLKNPIIYNTICRFVSFERVARTVNIPVENLIEQVNGYLLNKKSR